MAHRNARLTQFGRLLLVQRSIELGWPPAQAAEALGCVASHRLPTGWAASAPRPSWAGRPQLPTSPLPARPTRFPGPRVLATRRRHRPGPHRLAWRLHMFRSTIYGAAPPSHEPA
jgi:hypothetical protein